MAVLWKPVTGNERLASCHQRGDFFTESNDHISWKDLHLSTPVEEEDVSIESSLCDELALPPVAARAELTYPTYKSSDL